jgi:predicted ribosomally synthesized peptide with SipW-like signal peptide
MINKKTKIIAASITALASVGLVTAGTLALFTDYADSDTEAIAGKLDINISDYSMTNKDNINPGDNDPNAPKTYVPVSGDPLYNASNPNAEVTIPTTNHVIKFTVSNDGNESAKVRRTIYVSCKNAAGEVLDPSVFHLFTDGTETSGKSYVLSDGTEVTDISSLPEGTSIAAIKYFDDSDSFDGVGKGAQRENDTTVQSDDGVCAKTYEYTFGMEKEKSGNNYQGVTLNIDIVVEAMQYRNTTESKWVETARNTLTATTSGLSFPIVPNASSEANAETAVSVAEETPEETTTEATTAETTNTTGEGTGE